MARISTGMLLVCLVSSFGCTYSVYPVLSEKDLVHDVDLGGVWKAVTPPEQQSKGEELIVELSGFDKNSSYDFQFGGEPKSPDDYVARVGRFGGKHYFEIHRLEPGGPPLTRGLTVFAVARIELSGESFTLRELDDLKCRAALKKAGLPHMVYPKPGEMIEHTVLTMPTAELQKFLTAHEAEIFTGRTTKFMRIRKSAAASLPSKSTPPTKP